LTYGGKVLNIEQILIENSYIAKNYKKFGFGFGIAKKSQ
jgi:hypothetical protein